MLGASLLADIGNISVLHSLLEKTFRENTDDNERREKRDEYTSLSAHTLWEIIRYAFPAKAYPAPSNAATRFHEMEANGAIFKAMGEDQIAQRRHLLKLGHYRRGDPFQDFPGRSSRRVDLLLVVKHRWLDRGNGRGFKLRGLLLKFVRILLKTLAVVLTTQIESNVSSSACLFA